MSYTNNILFDSNGHTGNVYYLTIVRQSDGWAWDNVGEEMSLNPSRANMAITLSEIGTSGRFPVVVPTDLPVGDIYNLVVYEQAGGSPAETDDVETSYTISHGSIFGF